MDTNSVGFLVFALAGNCTKATENNGGFGGVNCVEKKDFFVTNSYFVVNIVHLFF